MGDLTQQQLHDKAASLVRIMQFWHSCARNISSLWFGMHASPVQHRWIDFDVCCALCEQRETLEQLLEKRKETILGLHNLLYMLPELRFHPKLSAVCAQKHPQIP